MFRVSVLDPGAPERMDEWGRAAFEWKDGCGIQAMGGKAYLTEKGLLTETLEWGLFEVCPGMVKPTVQAELASRLSMRCPLQCRTSEDVSDAELCRFVRDCLVLLVVSGVQSITHG